MIYVLQGHFQFTGQQNLYKVLYTSLDTSIYYINISELSYLPKFWNNPEAY